MESQVLIQYCVIFYFLATRLQGNWKLITSGSEIELFRVKYVHAPSATRLFLLAGSRSMLSMLLLLSSFEPPREYEDRHASRRRNVWPRRYPLTGDSTAR